MQDKRSFVSFAQVIKKLNLLLSPRSYYRDQACVNMIESGKESDVEWGNELGFIILPFHIGLHDDPLQYVRKAKKIVDRKKSSLEVVFTHLAAEVILKIFGLKVYGVCQFDS